MRTISERFYNKKILQQFKCILSDIETPHRLINVALVKWRIHDESKSKKNKEKILLKHVIEEVKHCSLPCIM